jgi:hypothetical protein
MTIDCDPALFEMAKDRPDIAGTAVVQHLELYQGATFYPQQDRSNRFSNEITWGGVHLFGVIGPKEGSHKNSDEYPKARIKLSRLSLLPSLLRRRQQQPPMGEAHIIITQLLATEDKDL